MGLQQPPSILDQFFGCVNFGEDGNVLVLGMDDDGDKLDTEIILNGDEDQIQKDYIRFTWRNPLDEDFILKRNPY